MTLALVASPAAQSSSTTTVSTNTFTPPAGSLMVALVAVGNPSNTATATTGTVTDSTGTTWTLKKRQNSANGTGAAEVWMADAGSAPAARQITLVGSKAGVLLSVVLFAGAQPVASQTGSTAGSTATANTLAITPTATGSYVVGSASDTSTGYTMGAATASTVIATLNDTTNGCAYGTWRSTSTTVDTSSQTYGVTPTPANETEKVAVEILASPPPSFGIAPSPAAQATSTTSVSTNVFTPLAGSLMVALVGVGNPTNATSATTGTVTDTSGSTWTLKKRQNSTTGTGAAEVWMADAGASPVPMQVTLTGSKAGVSLAVVLFTGAQPAAAQTGATAGSASTTANTLAITPTVTGSYIVGAASDVRAAYTMVGAASTTLIAAYNDATNAGAYGSWRSTSVTSSTASQTYGVTPAPSNETEKAAVEVLPYPPVSGLTDDFTTQDSVKWSGWATGAVDWLSSTKQVQVTPAPSYYALNSASTYTLVNSAAYVQLVQTPNIGNGSTEAWFLLDDYTGANNTLGLGFSNGSLVLREQIAGSYSDVWITYNATSMKWLRLRHDGTNVNWETSPDGSTWTVQRSKAPAVPITSLGLRLVAGYWGTETSPGAAIFDNVNMVGATAPAALSGSGSLTATTVVHATRSAALSGSGSLAVSGTSGGLPKVSTLTDDFTTQNATKWQGYDGTNVKVIYGQLQVAVDPAYYAISGQQAYSFVGSSAAVQVIQVPNAGNGTTEIALQVAVGSTYASVMWNGGGLVARERVNSVIDDGAGGVSYDPTAMRWWRIRADATTTYWEYGPDGQTWTLLRSKASGFDMSSVTPSLTAGYWGTETNPGGAVFDNFNVVPTAPSSPRTFYVDPAGSDAADGLGAGTAWASLDRVARVQLYPGDAVLFKRGGTWTGNLQPFGAGSAGTPVTVGAYGTGAAPIISGGGASGALGTYVPCEVHVPWMVLDGIEFRGSSYDDVTVYASDCTVQNCTIRWGSFGVSQRAGAARLKVLSNTITDVNVGRIGPGPDDDSGGCGVVLSGDGAEVAYNTISGCVYQSPDYGPDGSAVEIFAGTNAVVHHNRSIDCVTFAELGDASTANITFHTNVVTSTLAASSGLIIHGADSYGPVRGTKAYHNTIVVAAGGLAVWVGDGGEVDLRNNIVVVSGTADHTVLIGTTSLGMVEAGNVYWNPADATGASIVIPGGMSATSVFANPLFVSTTDLRLTPGSPALDRGGNLGYTSDYAGGVRPLGTAPDSGAYEGVVSAASMSTLTDNFTTQDVTKWQGWGANVSINAGRLQVNTTPSYAGAQSAASYNLSNSSIAVEIVQLPNLGNGSTSAYLQAMADANNIVGIFWEGGSFGAFYTVGGVRTTTTITYDATAHRMWRLRESGGTLYFEASANGVTWTNIRSSMSTPIPVTSISVILNSGYYGTETAPGAALFDNVNTPPVTGTPAALTGTGALTATATASTTPGTASLTDDFTTQDASKWSGYGAASFVESGRLRINTGSAYPGISSVGTYHLTGSTLSVEVPQVPNLGNGSTSAYLQAIASANNVVGIFWEGGSLGAFYMVGGVRNTVTTAYSPVAHKIWRLRESGGTLYFEASATGASWTNIRPPVATPINLATLSISLSSGYYGTETAPGNALFDNVNATYSVPPPSSPRTFYVDPAGSDSNNGLGTGAAWATVGKVTNTALFPGDQILFKRGATWVGNLTIADSGTSASPITVGAYGTGAAPIISGGGSSGVAGTVQPCEVYGSWVVLDGVEFRGSSHTGVYVNGTDCVIQNCTVRWGAYGIDQSLRAARLKVLSNTVVDVNVGLIGPGTNDDTGSNGILLEGDGAEVAYNTISGCMFTSPDYGVDGSAVEIWGATNATVHHNRASECVAFTELGNTATNNVTYYDNVFTSSISISNGFVIHGDLYEDLTDDPFGPVTNTKIYHNTVVLTSGDASAVGLWMSPNGEVDLRNNIFVVSGASKMVTINSTNRTVTEAGNVFWQTSGNTSNYTLPAALNATSTVADPRFVGPSDFRLVSGSPALNRGVNLGYVTDYAGNPRVLGTAPDSGAYEGAVAASPGRDFVLRGGTRTDLRSGASLRAGSPATTALSTSAALSGSGTLSATTSSSARSATAALSGSGALSATTSASNPNGVLADDFERANSTTVGNGWTSPTGETGQSISGGDLVRTGSGAYHLYVNPAGGGLPADYTVTMTIPSTGFTSTGSFFGIVGRWDGTNGVAAFFDGAPNFANLNIQDASGYLAAPVTVTADNAFPAAWSNTGIDHTMAMRMTGTLIEVLLDGVLVAHGTKATNATKTGTGYGLSGEGQGRHWRSIATSTGAGTAYTRTINDTLGLSDASGWNDIAEVVTDSAGLTDSVTVSTTATGNPTVAAALSGSGTLAATQVPRLTRAAALTGTGTLAGVPVRGGAATLAAASVYRCVSGAWQLTSASRL